MSRKFALAIALAIGTTSAQADTVLHLKFDEGAPNQPASVVLDSGSHGISAVGGQVGTASLPIFRADAGGAMLEFSGTGESVPVAASYIAISDPGVSPLDLTGPLTVEAVIHPTLMDHMAIVRKKGGLAGSGYFMDIQNGHLLFRLQDDVTRAISDRVLEVNRTYHVAGTWDGSMIRVYINHQLDGQFAYSGPLIANNDRLGIGALLRNSGTIDEGFRGFIDDVRISNRALTPNEFLPVPECSTLAALLLASPAVTCVRRRRAE